MEILAGHLQGQGQQVGKAFETKPNGSFRMSFRQSWGTGTQKAASCGSARRVQRRWVHMHLYASIEEHCGWHSAKPGTRQGCGARHAVYWQ